jgi:hypothetical protein
MVTQGDLGRLLIERENKQSDANEYSIELAALEKEISRLDAQIFIAQHELSDDWEQVLPENRGWENLSLRAEVDLAVLRPEGEESFTMEGKVFTYGEWSRSVASGSTNFNLVGFTGKATTPDPDSGITIHVWKKK